MAHQREQLEGAADQVAQTRNMTKEANKKITDLKRRIQREKVRNEFFQ